MSLRPPALYTIQIYWVDEMLGAPDVVQTHQYSVANGVLFWTQADRSVRAVNLSQIAELLITPPAFEQGGRATDEHDHPHPHPHPS